MKKSHEVGVEDAGREQFGELAVLGVVEACLVTCGVLGALATFGFGVARFAFAALGDVGPIRGLLRCEGAPQLDDTLRERVSRNLLVVAERSWNVARDRGLEEARVRRDHSPYPR